MFVLPELPYPANALAPTMSEDTVKTHHGKHHAKYVEVMNQLVEKLGWNTPTLEELVVQAHKSNEKKLFNNAAQAWNHGLYWVSMTPARTQPSAELAQAIQQAFGGHSQLREQFVTEGANHFASGWVWLVLQDGALKVISTHDADDTLVHTGVKPLLVCDVWEHAYYLDTKNDRKTFLEHWFDQLANWEFASRQFDAAKAGHRGWEYPARTRQGA
jgi:Fe-Mn family superoxide dismutase